MKKEISFLGHSKPLLTAMVQAKTPEEACCIITDSMYDGAEAFGIQLENLERKYRNVETLKSIFYYCGDKPIYITSYRNGESTGYTDEECEQYLLMGLEAGAALCDVMGDMYKQEKYGITYDEEAVKKQRELIDKIHSRGGEVLMSVHFYEFFDEDETMKVAHAIEDRGADIVKIVNGSYTEDQMYANINIIHRMKKELHAKFLFLANGKYSKLIRLFGPQLGVCTYLCVQSYRPINSKEQPKLRATKAIRDNIN